MSEAFRVKVHRISPEMIQHVDLARKPDPLSGIIFDLDKTLTNRARTMEAFAVCFRDKFLTAEANILYLQQLFLAADFN